MANRLEWKNVIHCVVHYVWKTCFTILIPIYGHCRMYLQTLMTSFFASSADFLYVEINVGMSNSIALCFGFERN